MTSVFCGIDWATDHHDIALLDQAGTLLGKLRIDDTPEGLGQLLRSPSTATDQITRSRSPSRPLTDSWSPAYAPPADPST
ncbi:hypothetical protein QFZ82_001858 [Streptomyces sp. V4I23]|nr:hypothetical protein [Streptomyces sp. V4I23]